MFDEPLACCPLLVFCHLLHHLLVTYSFRHSPFPLRVPQRVFDELLTTGRFSMTHLWRFRELDLDSITLVGAVRWQALLRVLCGGRECYNWTVSRLWVMLHTACMAPVEEESAVLFQVYCRW